jgi:hypothetical protein
MCLPDIYFTPSPPPRMIFGALLVGESIQSQSREQRDVLVQTIVSLAGLFFLLHAFFLASVQVIVYAGAVMVLIPVRHHVARLAGETRRQVQAGGLDCRSGGGWQPSSPCSCAPCSRRVPAPICRRPPPMATRLRWPGKLLFHQLPVAV